MSANVENDIYKLIAMHMRRNHASVPYHFDTSGINNTSRYSSSLYAQINGDPGFPDLNVFARSHPDFGDYLGLQIEVKKPGTTITKKDGSLVADPHIRDQAEWIKNLNRQGYYAAFGVSYESCKRLIDEYLTGTYNETIEFF